MFFVSKISIIIAPPSFMKFCPVVPEICRGQVHVPKKERRIKRRIRIIIIIRRYDYNLTIMKDNDRDIKFDIVIGHH
jgi:hypothetical protein